MHHLIKTYTKKPKIISPETAPTPASLACGCRRTCLHTVEDEQNAYYSDNGVVSHDMSRVYNGDIYDK